MFPSRNEIDVTNSKSDNPKYSHNIFETIKEIKYFLQNNLIFCPSCNTHLAPNMINLNEITIVCENQYVRI